MIAVNNVSKFYGSVVAVSEVSFAIDQGVTALLGPNGAGKSTLFRMLCGLTPASRGMLRVLGEDPRRNRDVRGSIGLVPQQDALFDHLTATDFVSVAARTHGIDAADIDRVAQWALEQVDLHDVGSKPVGQFSKGMRQRVKVAAALVNDPRVLVLDEPLTGLDPVQRRRMIALFHRLGDEGRCVLVSSHVLDEVARLGSNVLVVAQGRLVASGDYRDLRELMDDRPHRIRLGASDPRRLATELVGRGLVTALTLHDGDVVVETVDVDALGRQTRTHRRRARCAPRRGPPARRRPRIRVPLPRGGTMTDHATTPPLSAYPADVGRSSVGAGDALGVSYRLVLGQMRSTGRIIALLLLSLTATVAGFAVGTSDSATVDQATAVIANLGFAVVLPVVCLVFAGGAIGDLREDKTLVYLWLRPMHRWPIVVGAALAALTMATPIVLPAIVAAAALTGVGSGLTAATLIATLVGLVTYTSIFTMLGVWLKRHIVWGLGVHPDLGGVHRPRRPRSRPVRHPHLHPVDPRRPHRRRPRRCRLLDPHGDRRAAGRQHRRRRPRELAPRSPRRRLTAARAPHGAAACRRDQWGTRLVS